MADHKHFKGKGVVEHLKAARERGAKATDEIHGAESPGYISSGADSAKETSILLIGMWMLFSTFATERPLLILGLFSIGWFLWKIGRSSLLGWTRLERLHRLIEQERWEIQHHRIQEKEELVAMYKQKGFSGKLLDQVVDILMADDNRLLRVMLEEELGLTLESYEHPLKQSIGAGVGVILSVLFGALGLFLGGFVGMLSFLLVVFCVAVLLSSKLEGNVLIKSLIWNLSVGALSIGTIFLLARWIAS